MYIANYADAVEMGMPYRGDSHEMNSFPLAACTVYQEKKSFQPWAPLTARSELESLFFGVQFSSSQFGATLSPGSSSSVSTEPPISSIQRSGAWEDAVIGAAVAGHPLSPSVSLPDFQANCGI